MRTKLRVHTAHALRSRTQMKTAAFVAAASAAFAGALALLVAGWG